MEDNSAAVDGGELVVAGGQDAPPLVVGEGPLDDVATPVGNGVEEGWSPAAGTSS